MAFQLAEEKIRRLALHWQIGSVLAVRRRIGKGAKIVSDWKMDKELTVIGVNWPLEIVEKLSVNDRHKVGSGSASSWFRIGIKLTQDWIKIG